jgi:hypothetical protein
MVLSVYDIFLNADSNETLDGDLIDKLADAGIYNIRIENGVIYGNGDIMNQDCKNK